MFTLIMILATIVAAEVMNIAVEVYFDKEGDE